ncbi:hypothetical protein [Alloactinosynnema sp. L-07]|uniref:hypothetical protein n=1 Tax=Alloactinosynnema sp. L-07 TaxID=1653480 RepID=UPI00065EF99C|nr:hypothetical protein [Alloactinosynnema sp. L-07]CRK61990.1 hypothetical protein [Alloactinosynnema sp. L-07]
MARIRQTARFTSIWVALIAVVACACSQAEQSNPDGREPSERSLTYGYGPTDDPAVEYQPDVVRVGGGPEAIRSASADGLIWTLDPAAPGVDQLTKGKVAFVTSRAVGRVARRTETDAGVEVALAPVQLTEVFRTLHLHGTRAIDPGDLVFQPVPELAGRLDVDEEPLIPQSMVKPAAFVAAQPELPPARKNSFKVTVGNWEWEPYVTDNTLGITALYKFQSEKSGNRSAGIKGGFDIAFKTKNLRLVTDYDIVSGRAGGNLTAAVEGITGMTVDIGLGLGTGVNDTQRYRVELPVELNVPLPPEPGVPPMVVQIKWKTIVQLAFSAKNSTLTTNAEYDLIGPLGLKDGTAVAPALQQTGTGLVKNIDGVSVGISAMVLAWELRVMVGLGVPAAFGGPYAKFVVSLSILRGSDTTAPWGVCAQGTLKLVVGGGASYQVTPGAESYLRQVIGSDIKFERASEIMKDLPALTGYYPDQAQCRIP